MWCSPVGARARGRFQRRQARFTAAVVVGRRRSLFSRCRFRAFSAKTASYGCRHSLRLVSRGLQNELSSYVADVRQLPGDGYRPLESYIRWHWDARKRRPTFLKAALLLVLVQPTSAAVERVFSRLKAYFGDQQFSALADLIRTTLMLAENKREL